MRSRWQQDSESFWILLRRPTKTNLFESTWHSGSFLCHLEYVHFFPTGFLQNLWLFILSLCRDFSPYFSLSHYELSKMSGTNDNFEKISTVQYITLYFLHLREHFFRLEFWKEQNMLLQNIPLWHKDYFELNTLEKQQMQEGTLWLSLSLLFYSESRR